MGSRGRLATSIFAPRSDFEFAIDTLFHSGLLTTQTMDIIVHDPGRYHVSLDTVWEFEEAIHLDPRVRLVSSQRWLLSHVPNLAWRTMYRVMTVSPNHPIRPRLHAEAMSDTFAV